MRPCVVVGAVAGARDPGGLHGRRPAQRAVLVRPADEAHGVLPHPAADRALRDALDARGQRGLREVVDVDDHLVPGDLHTHAQAVARHQAHDLLQSGPRSVELAGPAHAHHRVGRGQPCGQHGEREPGLLGPVVTEKVGHLRQSCVDRRTRDGARVERREQRGQPLVDGCPPVRVEPELPRDVPPAQHGPPHRAATTSASHSSSAYSSQVRGPKAIASAFSRA